MGQAFKAIIEWRERQRERERKREGQLTASGTYFKDRMKELRIALTAYFPNMEKELWIESTVTSQIGRKSLVLTDLKPWQEDDVE